MPATIDLWLATAAGGVLIALAFYSGSMWLKNRTTRKRLTALSKLGSQHHLSFSSQEKLAYGVFGFDNLKKMLLVLQYDGAPCPAFTINLAQVRFCCVQRINREPSATAYSLYESIDKVGLQFHFKNGEPPVFLAFYSASCHQAKELPQLEAKARGWHCFLSKLLHPRQSSSWAEL
jgi:hypothetical protein